MINEQIRDIHYWGSRLREDKEKLDDKSKLNIIIALLNHTTLLEPQEVDIFLASKERLSNLEDITQYAIVEGKIAEVYSAAHPENWAGRTAYLESIRNSLDGFYTPSELNEIQTHILSTRDADALTTWLAGDHYGFRRIRNAYLPEITDLISIDTETGRSQDLTDSLFAEGLDDAVSRIDRILGVE